MHINHNDNEYTRSLNQEQMSTNMHQNKTHPLFCTSVHVTMGKFSNENYGCAKCHMTGFWTASAYYSLQYDITYSNSQIYSIWNIVLLWLLLQCAGSPSCHQYNSVKAMTETITAREIKAKLFETLVLWYALTTGLTAIYQMNLG